MACVNPNKCLSQCKDFELCTKDHKCRAPHICKVDRDCEYNEECKENSSGRRTCKVPEKRPSTINQQLSIKDECGSSRDCQMFYNKKPVCKEESGVKTCVESDKCKCLETEVCSSDDKCVPSAGCESNDDCDDTKVCRNFIPGGRKTCVEYTIEKESGQPCITNEGCIGEKTGKTVCKESHGQRTCVYPEQCLSNCFSDLGYCNSESRCKVTCNTAWDCKPEEICSSSEFVGEKTCQSQPVSIKHFDACEKNLDCKKIAGRKTVCKASKLEKGQLSEADNFYHYRLTLNEQ